VRARDVRERWRALRQDSTAEPVNPAADVDLDAKKKEPASLPDPRTLLVGFGSGVVVGIFVMWQIREMRRRKMQRSGL
jgi:hypothetical protein